MKKNQMLSFEELINSCFRQKDIYIPLIQRNYKWETCKAARLAADLWRAFTRNQNTYTVGMITLYSESDEQMQLIDGQQRIVTLYMLLKYLDPSSEYYSFRFERDEGVEEGSLTRQEYLRNINQCNSLSEGIYTDLFRFKNNYNAIVKELINIKTDENNTFEFDFKYATDFIKYIKNNIYFLLHISETEPFNEFINLNKNKTRFVVSDRIKANLVMDAPKEEKKDVMNVFKNLSKILFHNQDIWNLVSQGYYEDKFPNNNERKKNKLYPDENRLKILCCDRYGSDDYDSNSTLGYQYDEELILLKHYQDIMSIILSDINQNNWKSYNAFNCLYKLSVLKDNKRQLLFFKMLKNNNGTYLENYLMAEFEKLNSEPFCQACFIESQLCKGKDQLQYIDDIKDIYQEFNKKYEDNWLNNGSSKTKVFSMIYDNYIKNKYNELGE